MNLITYRPYNFSNNTINSMDQYMNILFDNIFFSDEENPLTDIYEDEKEYRVRFDIPGVEKKCIDICLEDSTIKISAERKDIKNDQRSNAIGSSSYNKEFTLPEDVNVDKIEGKFKNGCLLLIFPKLKSIAKNTKKIPIS